MDAVAAPDVTKRRAGNCDAPLTDMGAAQTTQAVAHTGWAVRSRPPLVLWTLRSRGM